MFRNPLTSRTSFLLYGVMAAELLTRFNVWQWLFLIVALSVLEAYLDRGNER